MLENNLLNFGCFRVKWSLNNDEIMSPACGIYTKDVQQKVDTSYYHSLANDLYLDYAVVTGKKIRNILKGDSLIIDDVFYWPSKMAMPWNKGNTIF